MAAKQGLQMGSFDLACAKVAALPLFFSLRESCVLVLRKQL